MDLEKDISPEIIKYIFNDKKKSDYYIGKLEKFHLNLRYKIKNENQSYFELSTFLINEKGDEVAEFKIKYIQQNDPLPIIIFTPLTIHIDKISPEEGFTKLLIGFTLKYCYYIFEDKQLFIDTYASEEFWNKIGMKDIINSKMNKGGYISLEDAYNWVFSHHTFELNSSRSSKIRLPGRSLHKSKSSKSNKSIGGKSKKKTKKRNKRNKRKKYI